jgi:uncharacterized protein YecA (UPF0149 family)
MQETKCDNEYFREFFTAETDEKVKNKMNKRLSELESKGHELVKRIKIGRNDLCPCGSGLKFKKCCINKVE